MEIPNYDSTNDPDKNTNNYTLSCHQTHFEC